MAAPITNAHTAIEPFYQELLRLKRTKGMHKHAVMHGIKHQSSTRSFADVVLDLLEVYRAMPYPKPKLAVVVEPRWDFQQGYQHFS